MLKNPIHNNLFKGFGFFLLVVSIFYLFKVVSKLELSFSDLFLLAKDKPLVLISCTLLYIATYILGSLIWSLWVVSLNGKSKIKTRAYLVLTTVYFYTNLQKYIPGNFFQFVGRNLKANQFGYSHKSLLSASLLEVIVSTGSGFVFVLLMAPLFWGEIQQIVIYFNMGTIIVVFTIFIIALVTVIAIFKARIFTHNNIAFQFQKYSKEFYISIISFLITFALFGLINLLLFNNLFDIPFTLKSFAILAFGFSVSWLVGFVVPGSPGGIAIREAVFVLLLNGLIPEKDLIYVIIFIRLLGIAIEILLFFIGWLFLLVNKKTWTDIVS